MNACSPTTARPTARSARHRRATASRRTRSGIDRRPAVERHGAAALEDQRRSELATAPESGNAGTGQSDGGCGRLSGARRSRVASAISSMNVHCDVILAQLTRLALPSAGATPRRARRDSTSTPAASTGASTASRHARLLALGLDEILVAIDAGERRDVAHATTPAASARASPRAPRRTDGRDRVTEIVLAVAERALAVLPRLAPVDRRQRDQSRRSAPQRRAARLGIERAALLQRVPIRRVVIDAPRRRDRRRTAR